MDVLIQRHGNYDASANTYDGSCLTAYGDGTDPAAYNYDANAMGTCDDANT